jgi:hypothetical protein
MPTDLGVAPERKGKAAQAETQAEVTILLVCVIITLSMLFCCLLTKAFQKQQSNWCASFETKAAILRASSLLSSLAAERLVGRSFK